ncbi:high affinity cationic amino acid transporter 1-like [Tubulanus polymorphus]|uniref:high affinity cationic amino acid transporter 1-like n=1 Tax=Tubulanus polymorphus TaxID=672921 RepID=UPI003DA508A1
MVLIQSLTSGLVNLRRALFRVKKIHRSQDYGDAGVSDLSQCLSTLDLTSLGIGSILGAGVYVVAGQVAKSIAGPAVILSFTIAAFASVLSGLCYAEFGSRVPKTTGSAYAYSYSTVGEFIAFIIGWNLILEYMIGTAADARALSGSIDFLTGNRIRDVTLEKIGRIPGLDSYPDFLGFLVTILITVVLAIGVKTSAVYTTIFNALNICLVVFIIVLGLFHIDFANWTEPPGFFPYGANGVLSGAASCFYAFVGFDIIATTGAEARTPSRSIPIAVVVSLVFCYICYVGVSAVTSLVAPVTTLASSSPIAEAFGVIGIHWAKYVIGVGAVFGLCSSLLGSMFPLPRIIFAMSIDGLFFKQFTQVNERTETPLLATVVPGVITAVFTALFNLHELVEMMSIGTLLAYTLVCTSVLILRYQPDEMTTACGENNNARPKRRTLPKKVTKPDVAEALKSDLYAIKSSIENSRIIPSRRTARLTERDDDGASVSEVKLITGLTPDCSPAHNGHGPVNDADSNRAQTIEDYSDDEDSSESDENAELIQNPNDLDEDDESSDLDIDAIVDEFRRKVGTNRSIDDHDQTIGRQPTRRSGKFVCYATSALCALFLLFSLLVTLGIEQLEAKHPGIIISIVVVIVLIVTLFAFIWCQPQDKIGLARLTFKVPLVPLVPIVAIFINIYLMVRLSSVTWIRFLVWMGLGMGIYFFYGLRHSTEAGNEIVDEERVLLSPLPNETSDSPLIISDHQQQQRDLPASSADTERLLMP